MVLTVGRAQARLYSISGCRFIAIEVKRACSVSKESTWSNVPWLNFTLHRGKLSLKCTVNWKMCAVMSKSCSLPTIHSFSRWLGTAGEWASSRQGTSRLVQWISGENSPHSDEGQAKTHYDRRLGVGKEGAMKSGKTFADKEDLFEVCGALHNGLNKQSIGLQVVAVSWCLLITNSLWWKNL
jgi:hypothetical protein